MSSRSFEIIPVKLVANRCEAVAMSRLALLVEHWCDAHLFHYWPVFLRLLLRDLGQPEMNYYSPALKVKASQYAHTRITCTVFHGKYRVWPSVTHCVSDVFSVITYKTVTWYSIFSILLSPVVCMSHFVWFLKFTQAAYQRVFESIAVASKWPVGHARISRAESLVENLAGTCRESGLCIPLAGVTCRESGRCTFLALLFAGDIHCIRVQHTLLASLNYSYYVEMLGRMTPKS